ncbi:MAG: mannitol dehydrogenase family protein [Paracoccaceae bacterium]
MQRPVRPSPAPAIGIVHFGPGAFFRAFNAAYTHDAMAVDGGAWGIAAVSLKSPRARDQLQPQGGVFTALERGPTEATARLITSVADVHVAPEDPTAIVNLLADPAIKIVSLTITEKGYGLDPVTGGADIDNADIAHDLQALDAPRSAVGFLVAGLQARQAAGVPPFTVLSCDNLPSNGRVTRAVVVDFARRAAPDIADWIASEVPFPCSMVDRITPATTPDDIARLAAETGTHDPALVVHEPFRQWVIEDHFADGRPAWDKVGAQFVQSVDAHEMMKLRCLNGTHSALAYLGYLAGHETISEAIEVPGFAAFCHHLWQHEILPTVPQPEGEDLFRYTDMLLERYRNPNIQHRTWQIAMDGSQKLPQRVLGTVRDQLAQGPVPQGLCLVVAAWMRYVSGVDERGQTIDVRDPLASQLKAAFGSALDARGKVTALLSIEDIFGTDLPHAKAFVDAVVAWFERLHADGAGKTVAQFESQVR